MKHAIRAVVAATALAASAVSAQAATTTLTFSELIDVESSLHYSGTAGGDLTVTSNKGSLTIVLGELGVATWNNLDPRINGGETITFSFTDEVKLIGWDMDDLNHKGSNNFGLKVDTGAVGTYSLDSIAPTPVLSGKSFTFSYKGDAYFIDTLKFASVTPVPEASSVAMTLAGLGVVGFIAARRRRAA
ncbi:MAG: PEP-CTERM sorting domain-containing protein [Pseudomonadota bacterium]